MDRTLAILANTPAWVWLVLALVLWVGVRGLRPARTGLAGMLATPAIFIGIAIAHLVSAPALTSVLPVWLIAAALGMAVGAAWAARLPVRVDRAAGIIETPGTAFWLVVGLLLFGCRYAIGVTLGMQPELRSDPFWMAVPFAVAGFGTGMTVAWAAVRLRTWFNSRQPPLARGLLP